MISLKGHFERNGVRCGFNNNAFVVGSCVNCFS